MLTEAEKAAALTATWWGSGTWGWITGGRVDL